MKVVWAEGQQRSGRLGATIASHNAAGAYLRAGSIPVNPNTDRQVAIRNAVRALTIDWANVLTQSERDAWDVYAANVSWFDVFGAAIKLQGLNHYVRSNVQNVALGFGRLNAAPTIMNIGAAELALGCTASEATQQLSITFDDAKVWATEAGAFQHFYMGLPQNASIKFFKSPFRYVVSVAGVTPAVSPLAATAPWPFAEGQRIWLQSRIMRADGRLSEFAQVNFLAAA